MQLADFWAKESAAWPADNTQYTAKALTAKSRNEGDPGSPDSHPKIIPADHGS